MRQVPFTNYMENTLRPLTCNKDSDCGSTLICFLSKCEGELEFGDQLILLNNVRNDHMGSWSADLNEAGQWLQTDLREERLVTKLATQGRPSWSPPQWVTSYKILFGSDSVHVKWEEYKKNDIVKVWIS